MLVEPNRTEKALIKAFSFLVFVCSLFFIVFFTFFVFCLLFSLGAPFFSVSLPPFLFYFFIFLFFYFFIFYFFIFHFFLFFFVSISFCAIFFIFLIQLIQLLIQLIQLLIQSWSSWSSWSSCAGVDPVLVCRPSVRLPLPSCAYPRKSWSAILRGHEHTMSPISWQPNVPMAARPGTPPKRTTTPNQPTARSEHLSELHEAHSHRVESLDHHDPTEAHQWVKHCEKSPAVLSSSRCPHVRIAPCQPTLLLAALRTVLHCALSCWVCAICAEYLCRCTPDTTEKAAELIALSNYFDWFHHYGIRTTELQYGRFNCKIIAQQLFCN